MSCQAPGGQPSSPGRFQLLPTTHYRRNHHQPPTFRRPIAAQPGREGQHISILRHILTVPYFREHYEATRQHAADTEDYVFVEAETDADNTDKMVQLTEVPDEHFEGAQAGPIEDDGDFTDTGKPSFLPSFLSDAS